MGYYISDEIKTELSALVDAMEKKDYPLICGELGRFTAPFTHEAAFHLLDNALLRDLKTEVFEAILDNSPPLPEIACSTCAGLMIMCISREGKSDRTIAGDFGLLEIAAGKDRADLLSLFLERGAGPNRPGRSVCYNSPLEAAVMGGALNCLELLMRQPGLDTAWTDELLTLWARREWAHSELKECFRIMAPRFTGWVQLSGYPLPIPEPMKPWIIADMVNWPLLECFCRERGPISPEDGRAAIRTLADEIVNRQSESEAACAALTALLENCPDLLREEEACQALVRCFFAFSFGNARERLRPWVNSLDTWHPMAPGPFLPYGGEGKYFLELWRKLLPNGPVLAINRWSERFADSLDPQDEETISYVLNDCRICGEGKKGALSPLAAKVLHHGSLSVILPLLRRSDGLFAPEDPDALLRHVLYRPAGKGGNLVAERIKKMLSAPSERTPEQTRRLVEKFLILQNLCP